MVVSRPAANQGLASRRGIAVPVGTSGFDVAKAVRLNAIEIGAEQADRMFDMGFLPDVRRILAALPKTRQTLLFSATMPAEIRSLADGILHRPAVVELGDSRPVETVSHAMVPVEQTQKAELLLELLRSAGSGKVLVFTRTKHRAKKLAQQLAKTGLLATSLQGNLSQNRRQEAMDNFRSGRVKILVATDIAARGIDVSQISHVINRYARHRRMPTPTGSGAPTAWTGGASPPRSSPR
jgi:superfamily II DNA/RNA helicase